MNLFMFNTFQLKKKVKVMRKKWKKKLMQKNSI